MTFIDFLFEIDDIGTRVQGLGGSTAGSSPAALPPGTFDEVKRKFKKKNKKNRKKDEVSKVIIN